MSAPAVGRYELVQSAEGCSFWRGGNVDFPPNDFLLDVMNTDPSHSDRRIGRTMDFAPDAWPVGTVIEIREPGA